MSVTASSLRELHRIHKQLADLRGRLERGPKQIKIRIANVAQSEAQIQAVQATIKAARVRSDQQQLQLKSSEAKILNLNHKLNTAASNREYQLLKEQIAADEMANSVLADEILEALEKIDGLNNQLGVTQENHEKVKADLLRVKESAIEEAKLLNAEVSRLTQQLQGIESSLPAEFLAGYRRMVTALGEDAMAQVDGDFCGGCLRRITTNVMNELIMARAVFCKACGRMIYLPEDRTPSHIDA